VGAGSAGCALAYRLSENPQVKVLLLEAGGPDDRLEFHVPLLFAQVLGTEHDWNYYTEPQANLAQRKLFWPRGKVLGGCSSINAMIYIRGHRQVYDSWQALGCPGWDYDALLPYFKKAQHQERGGNDYHGINGPLNVADLREPNPLSVAFVNACAEIGVTLNPDFNGETQDGVGIFQVTQRNGERCSAAAAFLRPALSRSNLTVKTQAPVTEILITGHGDKLRAQGVVYLQHGQPQEVFAEQEIVLTGGAINSPQLLMLSGIGPASQLEALDIPVRVDLPGVGQNLQDHLSIFLAYYCNQPLSLENAKTEAAMIDYQTHRRGPLTSNAGEAGCFLRTKLTTGFPDLQIHFAPGWFLEHGAVQVDGHGFTIAPTMVCPQSRGEITLSSRSPLAAPIIQPNYLQENADLEVLVEAFHLARRLAETSILRSYISSEYEDLIGVTTDTEIRDFIRRNAQTLYHPVGTCKMGQDPLAVVDPQLNVYGVAGLRVADASIMPLIPNGNTNAPAIMIGEKAADLLKNS
jgi:choline dehydrogenase